MDSKIKKFNLSIRDVSFISIFTAIIAVCAQISVPMPMGVPFTMQTFAIPLAGVILGAKKGTLSAVVYILLGIIGVPVFAGFRGGFGVLFGATGGYIITFPIMALFAGISSDICNKYKFGKIRTACIIAIGLILGSAVNYISGMTAGKFIMSFTWFQAFAVFVFPYIPTAVIKIVLTGIFGVTIKKILLKNRILM